MKTERELAIQNLMKIMPDHTETAFTVKQEGDDSGSYLCVYVSVQTRVQRCAKPSQHPLRDGESCMCGVLTDLSSIFWRDTKNESGGSRCIVGQRCEVKAQLSLLRGFWDYFRGLSCKGLL